MGPNAASGPSGLTPVHFEHTADFPHRLSELGITLLVSTYQAGKLVVIGSHQGQATFAFPSFEQCMGVAVAANQIAVGSRRQIWTLQSAKDLGPHLEPLGTHDGCWLTRRSHVTGEIHGHELAWAGSELWIVNTLFSCLCTLHPEYSFVPRWKPKFVTAWAAEDRCHLNGLALDNGRPRLVTALAETDTPAGWRPRKAETGLVIDVPSGEVLLRGLAMPHSPRVHDGRLWVLDSGRGRLSLIDAQAGRTEPVVELPGYTRGLAFVGSLAFVGLSRIRETNVFGGLPIAEQREALQCGVAVVDLRTGRQVAGLAFRSGVEEVFAVEVLHGQRNAAVIGADPVGDGGKAVWLAPPPR